MLWSGLYYPSCYYLDMWEKTRTEAETEAVDAIQTRCLSGLGSVAAVKVSDVVSSGSILMLVSEICYRCGKGKRTGISDFPGLGTEKPKMGKAGGRECLEETVFSLFTLRGLMDLRQGVAR